MFALFKLENLINNLKNIFDRFPISIIIVLINFILFIVVINFELEKNIELYFSKSIFSLIIAFFFSIGVYLTTEKYNIKKIDKQIYQIIPIIFSILFFIFLKTDFESSENIIFFILTMSGIISYIFFAAFLKKCTLLNNKNDEYYPYFYKISVVFLISSIFGILLFILGSIGIGSTFTLFDIYWEHSVDLYQNWAIISFSLLTPIFGLTQIPLLNEEKTDLKQNKFFDFLIKYLGVSFIIIYFLILYAYSIKVLLNFGDWPKGEVAWLVIGFSSMGYIVYMFSYIFEETSSIIKKIRKVFPFVVIPQLFMLFYAIYLRIAQYDLTINRYFVVVFGIWLLTISLFLIISKKKFIGAIPVVLTLFTIIISVGPWSVYSLPESRQMNRLEDNLVKAGILDIKEIPQTIKTIKPLEKFEDIDKDLSREIYNGISYLCYNNDCELIKELFKGDYKHKLGDDMSKWEVVEKITSNIKVRTYYDNGDYTSSHIYLYNEKGGVFPLDINGYSKIINILAYNTDTNSFYAKIDADKKTLEIIENNAVIENINIENVINKLYDSYKASSTNLSKDEMIFELKGEKYNLLLILESISIKNNDYTGTEEFSNNYANGYVLLTEAK